MPTTPAGIRYPAGTAPINLTTDFLNLATDVDTYVTTSITTQNAAVNATLGNLNNQKDLDIAVIMGAF
jgi:hypothetical protein